MPTTKRALIAPREDVVDKSGHLPGDRALPKGGGDPPKRSRRGKAGTAEASGGDSISDAAQPALSVAAGAGVDTERVACTTSYLDTTKVKLDKLRASAERQLKEQGYCHLRSQDSSPRSVFLAHGPRRAWTRQAARAQGGAQQRQGTFLLCGQGTHSHTDSGAARHARGR